MFGAERLAPRERGGATPPVVDPADARASLVRLTTRGRAVSCAAVEISSAIETRWREQLGVATPELRAILKSLKSALGGPDV